MVSQLRMVGYNVRQCHPVIFVPILISSCCFVVCYLCYGCGLWVWQHLVWCVVRGCDSIWYGVWFVGVTLLLWVWCCQLVVVVDTMRSCS